MKHDGRAVLGFIAQSAVARAQFYRNRNGRRPLAAPVQGVGTRAAKPVATEPGGGSDSSNSGRLAGCMIWLFRPGAARRFASSHFSRTCRCGICPSPRLISTLEPPLPEGVLGFMPR